MQNKQVTCLIILDLLAVFDTISHSKLINRLKFRFGLDGVVLDWITDYLANCTQGVVIKQDKFSNLATSSPVTLVQEIPQDSVLGPKSIHLVHLPIGWSVLYQYLIIKMILIYFYSCCYFFYSYCTYGRNKQTGSCALIGTLFPCWTGCTWSNDIWWMTCEWMTDDWMCTVLI